MRFSQQRNQSGARGFTLIELLFTVSIMGILGSIGATSYETARRQSRDVARVSDVKQMQVAIELYFEDHGHYPFDGHVGLDGSILEDKHQRILSLTGSGFSTEPVGRTYMLNIPKNPSPGGTPYIYRSLMRDGRDCNIKKCDAYVVLFTLEGPMGGLLPGPHAISSEGVSGGNVRSTLAGVDVGEGEIVGLQFASEIVQEYAVDTGKAVTGFVSNKDVETVAEVAIAPVATVAAVANTGFAAHATAQGGYYILHFLTQPFLLLVRRRRKQWGVVYQSLTRLPVDLAIVRLINADTGAMVKSVVTDEKGRFSFLISKEGRYRMEVQKHGVSFPSEYAQDKVEDGEYHDLYHGGVFEVSGAGAFVHPSIPVDIITEDAADGVLVQRANKKRMIHNFSLISPVLGALSLIVKPSPVTLSLFVAQIISYMIFKRLAEPYTPKSWGIVHEVNRKKPVNQAVLRIFALPYHKLLETQVTDSRGRYSFRVGANNYYLTVSKKNFLKTESEPFDLREKEGVTVISVDLPLKRGQEAIIVADTSEPGEKTSLLVQPGAKPNVATQEQNIQILLDDEKMKMHGETGSTEVGGAASKQQAEALSETQEVPEDKSAEVEAAPAPISNNPALSVHGGSTAVDTATSEEGTSTLADTPPEEADGSELGLEDIAPKK